MSIDIFDVTYCKGSKCLIKSTCGRCLDRFTEWFSAQDKPTPVASMVCLDFSNGATTCEVFLETHEVRK